MREVIFPTRAERDQPAGPTLTYSALLCSANTNTNGRQREASHCTPRGALRGGRERERGCKRADAWVAPDRDSSPLGARATDYDIYALTALHMVPVGGKTGLGGLRMYRRSAYSCSDPRITPCEHHTHSQRDPGKRISGGASTCDLWLRLAPRYVLRSATRAALGKLYLYLYLYEL